MASFIGNSLKGFDIFGHQMGVSYKGEGAVKTRLGGFLTIGTYVLLLINLLNLATDFKDKRT